MYYQIVEDRSPLKEAQDVYSKQRERYVVSNAQLPGIQKWPERPHAHLCIGMPLKTCAP